MPKRKITKKLDTPEVNSPSEKKFTKPPWKNILLIGLLIIAVLFWIFKGQFIAVMVNGQPISRWQLNSELEKKFGEQVLEGLINERLILAAAKQKGIFITSNDIDGRIKQIEERLKGSMALDDALKAQGLTRDGLKKQIEIQISIEKLFDKESTVSTQEVEDYLGRNKEAYKNATDEAAVKKEIAGIIRQQKVADSFDKWFTEIRKDAKIQKFL